MEVEIGNARFVPDYDCLAMQFLMLRRAAGGSPFHFDGIATHKWRFAAADE
jgi:hypothetical protein